MSVSVDDFIADRDGVFGWTAGSEELFRSGRPWQPPRLDGCHRRSEGCRGREVTHVCAAQRKQRAPPAASAPVDGIEPEPGAALAAAGALGARHPEMWPAVRPPGELPAAGDLGARRRDLLL